MTAPNCIALVLLAFLTANRVHCANIRKTDINIVNDENRYIALHPDESYEPFDSTYNAKGNIFFKLGERISGDSVVLTYLETTSYTRPTNAEVSIWYPAEGVKGYSISCIEFITDFSTKKAAAYLVGNGGLFQTFAETLLVANQTNRFGYQLVIYGY